MLLLEKLYKLDLSFVVFDWYLKTLNFDSKNIPLERALLSLFTVKRSSGLKVPMPSTMHIFENQERTKDPASVSSLKV
jgi:hypothetical protein